MAKFQRPLTFAEFEHFRKELLTKKFKGAISDPVAFGVKRSEFEAGKLRELISAAEGVRGTSIIKRVAAWKRELARVEATKGRLEKISQEGKEQEAARASSPPAASANKKRRPSKGVKKGDL